MKGLTYELFANASQMRIYDREGGLSLKLLTKCTLKYEYLVPGYSVDQLWLPVYQRTKLAQKTIDLL